MSEKEFELIPSDEIPGRHSRSRGLYDRIIEAIRKSEHDTVELSVPGKEYGTLYSGLRSALKRNEVNDIHVFGRSEVIYLTKKK